jgi:redox-sensitive bicupin YhaK (pirin superfamily)
MINLRRSTERHYVRNGSVKMWKTFDHANVADPLHRGFRSLESLNEVSLPPGTGFKLALDGGHEVVNYIRQGGVLVRNNSKGSDMLGPGWCQYAISHPWTLPGMLKTFPSYGTHLFVISMRPHPIELKPAYAHKHIPFADRHGKLRQVASPNGEDSSLRLQSDVRLYSSLLDQGHHVVHELSAGRGAWLQVIAGRIRLVDESVEAGDGAALEDEAAVSFTAQEASEILLFDLP